MRKPATPDYDTKARLHLGVSGSIIEWHEEQGYGFVQTDLLPEKIFFHAKTLTHRQHLPKIGETITVHAQYDHNKKRWTAVKITSANREQSQKQQQQNQQAIFRPNMPALKWSTSLIAIWFAALTYAQPLLAINYAIISLIALCLYAWDKRSAIRQNSRIPESSLHIIALLGGWAGALLARHLFRHKTQKQPFVSLFWLTVVINIAITAYLIFSGSLKV